jgi:hypothetical protein
MSQAKKTLNIFNWADPQASEETECDWLFKNKVCHFSLHESVLMKLCV